MHNAGRPGRRRCVGGNGPDPERSGVASAKPEGRGNPAETGRPLTLRRSVKRLAGGVSRSEAQIPSVPPETSLSDPELSSMGPGTGGVRTPDAPAFRSIHWPQSDRPPLRGRTPRDGNNPHPPRTGGTYVKIFPGLRTGEREPAALPRPQPLTRAGIRLPVCPGQKELHQVERCGNRPLVGAVSSRS